MSQLSGIIIRIFYIVNLLLHDILLEKLMHVLSPLSIA